MKLSSALLLCVCTAVAVHAVVFEHTTAAMTALRRVKAAQASDPAAGLRGQPGEYQYELPRPEGNRTFWVWVPNSYNGSAVPLVFTFHGLGDECYRFGHATGMVDKAEAEGFILVYPCGTPGGFFGVETAWNAGRCCMEGSPIDDIAFARDMVNFMTTNWAIDSARVFSTGFSNGAFMTETLLCNSSDVFMGGASVSGTVVVLPGNDGGLAACDASYAANAAYRPWLHIHGNLDFVVPWDGDKILGFPNIPEDFARWAQRNKCTGSPVNTFTNGPYSNQVYESCAVAGQTVELVKNNGGTHEWPSDQYFDTATYIWNFLSKINRSDYTAQTDDM